MSTMPSNVNVPADASRLPMTLPRLAEMKRLGEPIVMVTAYDYPSARAAEAGCDAVKLEGGGPTSVARARAIAAAGIPVMGHVGLTPQTSTALGGYKAQGRNAEAAARVQREALALQEAGCFAIVFEAIPSAVAEAVMPKMRIPVIGIGAGPATDGQVLVFHDLLGIRQGVGAKFVKRYADLLDEMTAGVAQYADDVRTRRYPGPEHEYSMPPEELERFRRDRE